MESCIIHTFHECCSVPFSYKRTRGKYHSVIKVFNAEVKMQGIIDALGEVVYLLLIDVVLRKETKIVLLIMKLLFAWYYFFILIDENINAIIKNTYNILVFSMCHTAVFEHLVYLGLLEVAVLFLDL